jgi:alkaline phosphatase D
MLGKTQKQWLFDGMNASTARWQVLAQQVLMARMDTDPDPKVASFGGSEMDKWDGYAVERDEVVAHLASAAKARSFNPVVISGDIHRNYVFDLKTNWDDPSQKAAIGTEFVGTSLTSEGDEPLDKDGQFTTVCGDFNGNPHNHLYDNHRGYVLCTVDQETWHADYRVLPTVKDPNAHASTLISFAVEWAEPGAQVDGACSAPGAEPYGSGHVG